MSDGIKFKTTLDVTAESEAHVTRFAIEHLKGRGYSMTAPNEKWETPREFNKRLGISKEGIHRAMARPGCPNVLIQYGPGRGPNNRRIHGICSNQAFDAFILKFKS